MKSLHSTPLLYAAENKDSRRSSILPQILIALLDHLLMKPDLYLDEMADFIWDEYELEVSDCCVQRSLISLARTCAPCYVSSIQMRCSTG